MAIDGTLPTPRSTGRWKPWHLVLAYSTAFALLTFGYGYFDDLARGESGTLSERLLEQLTGVYCAAVLFPLIVKLARRFRLRQGSWLRSVPVHLLAMVGFSFLHTSLIAVTREILFPLAGLGDYDYGILPIRYLMEFFNDVILYWMSVGFVFVLDHFRESRDRELRTSQLETRLAQAQLQALRLQLQPHFLFNALNTVSAMIYENPAAADGMITRLGDLLRLSLRHSDAQEVTWRRSWSSWIFISTSCAPASRSGWPWGSRWRRTLAARWWRRSSFSRWWRTPSVTRSSREVKQERRST